MDERITKLIEACQTIGELTYVEQVRDLTSAETKKRTLAVRTRRRCSELLDDAVRESGE